MRIHSIIGASDAFLAGIYAESKIVIILITIEIIIAGTDTYNFNGTVDFKILVKFFETIEITNRILIIPVTIPIGIPTIPIHIPSKLLYSLLYHTFYTGLQSLKNPFSRLLSYILIIA